MPELFPHEMMTWIGSVGDAGELSCIVTVPRAFISVWGGKV